MCFPKYKHVFLCPRNCTAEISFCCFTSSGQLTNDWLLLKNHSNVRGLCLTAFFVIHLLACVGRSGQEIMTCLWFVINLCAQCLWWTWIIHEHNLFSSNFPPTARSWIRQGSKRTMSLWLWLCAVGAEQIHFKYPKSTIAEMKNVLLSDLHAMPLVDSGGVLPQLY